MTINVGNARYQVRTCMAVLLDYLAEFGESYLAGDDSPELSGLMAVRLAWCAIEGERPTFERFLAAAARDKSFAATAIRIRRAIFARFGVPGRAEETEDTGERADELDVLQMMIVAGVPVSLADKLPIYAVLELVRRKLRAEAETIDGDTQYIRATPQNVRDLKALARGGAR